MTWFAFTIISPILNALVNYIDKYLIEKVVAGRGIGSLIIFSALMGLPVALLIFIFNPHVFGIAIKNALLIMLNGTFYVAWVLPYLYALQKDEASVVAPLFQLSSVMAFILGFFVLGENISYTQLAGCVLILLGAIGLSLESEFGKAVKLKVEVLLLMLLSCFFVAIGGVIFKFIALEESFWITSFWENMGVFLSALILFSVKDYRRQFLHIIRNSGPRVFALNAVNETIVIIGKLTLGFATLIAPIAVVFFVSEGLQPFFVLAFGSLFSIFLPKFAKEKTESNKIFQKLLAICVMFAGTYLVSF